jgi:hypothetical protein
LVFEVFNLVFILKLLSCELGFEFYIFLGNLLDLLHILFNCLVLNPHEVVQSLFVLLELVKLLFKCTVFLYLFLFKHCNIALQVIGVQLELVLY